MMTQASAHWHCPTNPPTSNALGDVVMSDPHFVRLFVAPHFVCLFPPLCVVVHDKSSRSKKPWHKHSPAAMMKVMTEHRRVASARGSTMGWTPLTKVIVLLAWCGWVTHVTAYDSTAPGTDPHVWFLVAQHWYERGWRQQHVLHRPSVAGGSLNQAPSRSSGGGLLGPSVLHKQGLRIFPVCKNVVSPNRKPFAVTNVPTIQLRNCLSYSYRQ